MMLWCAIAFAQVPASSQQLVTGWAADIDASHAMVQRWERVDGAWVPVGNAVPARLGHRGLSWGIGRHPAVDEGPQKREGDGRSPMGIFDFGTAFADAPPVLEGGWPVLQTTVRDLWVEDPAHPAYNTHVRVPEGRPMTPWEVGQRMKLGDAAHELKLVVDHNTTAPVPGHGSAIFLHIWRTQGSRATSGCTAMPSGELRSLLGWLEPDAEPVYALLTDAAWQEHGAAWGLPSWPPSHTPSPPPQESK